METLLYFLLAIVGLILCGALGLGLVAATIWGISATVRHLLRLLRLSNHVATPLLHGFLTGCGLIAYCFWCFEVFN